jgi:hypothetical protein
MKELALSRFFHTENSIRGAAMFYNYQHVIVCMLLLPAALNIVLPLVMLVVWLLKQLFIGKKKMKEVVHVEQENRMPLPTT